MSPRDRPLVRIRPTVLLRRSDGRLCLVRHLKDGRRYWLLPGGGQEPFETLEAAARRELAEEVGVPVSGFRLLALRESMNRELGRHIQFPILEGLEPDFSRLAPSRDPRVEGVDFFLPEELPGLAIYPAFGDDLVRLARGEPVPLFKTLDWVP